ncbi:MAG: T9SS type A sorting domain-containing protein [Bacteroidota bacterium]
MKSITIAATLLVILTNVLSAQLWERSYDVNQPTPRQLIQGSDGGFVIAGSMYDSLLMEHRGFLLKTDVEGSEEWRATWNGAVHSYGYAVIELADGGYLVSGTEVVPGNSSAASLRKFDGSGILIWEREYVTDPKFNNFRSISKADEDHLILLGSAGPVDNAWLSKIDTAGNMIWEKKFSETEANIDGHIVKTTLDEGFILLIERSHSYINKPPAVVIIKTNAAGTEEWRAIIESEGEYIEALNIFQEPDGAYIATAMHSNSSTSRDYWMAKLNENGDLLWRKKINEGNDFGVQAARIEDGNYILLGHNAKIIKTDTSGTVLWTKQINHNLGPVYARSMTQSSDGCFVITGQSNISDNLFLLKDDSVGAVVYSYERINDLAIDFSIYPNPIKDRAILDITGITQLGLVNLRLYDLRGKEIFTKKITFNKTSIQFPNHLPGGAYVGVLEAEGKLLTAQVIYLE